MAQGGFADVPVGGDCGGAHTRVKALVLAAPGWARVARSGKPPAARPGPHCGGGYRRTIGGMAHYGST